jgi:aminopeptidase N
MKRIAAFAAAALTGAVALQAAETTTQLPRTVRPTHYALEIATHAEELRFDGKAGIDLEVLTPTSSITLNAIGMTFASARLSGGGTDQPAKVAVDAANQAATFTFAKALAPGAYRLDIDYAGSIDTQAVGLFALDYETPEGKRRGLFTQFENSDARRLVPCWDEPAYKATFQLTATVPAAHMAVSNMPGERTELGGGLARVRFARTPPMSTYLLFLAVGELERATTRVGDTEIGVVTRKGALDQAHFVLDASAEALREYNDYFGAPYPLPKLDNVAAPGRSQFFGAMENWGAILSFEYILLIDPSISTQEDRQGVFSVAAHEISHQWFGDLVTMAWWDDLWLNEGFASWMAGRTTAKLRPEWNTQLGVVRSRDDAMARDALATTHPVVQHIETVEQASQAFDSITYQKGEAVIRMLEGYVGPEAWRAGVRSYIEKYTHKNTLSDDLWREIEAAAGQPILAIAHDFTLQPGVPLVVVDDVTCSGGASRVSLSQREYTKDRPDKKPLAWRVPVILRAGAGEPARTLMTGGKASVTVPGCGAVLVNAGQSGYYRTLYAPAQFARVADGFASLPAIDQMGVLSDGWALGRAGLQPVSDVLDLARRTPVDADPQVWGQVAQILGGLDGYSRADAKRHAAFRGFARGVLNPVFARVGWAARADEPSSAAILRNGLIATLGALGDPAVVEESRRRFRAQASDPEAMPGPLKKTILRVVARHADAATWDALHQAAVAEKTPLVKEELYFLLAAAEDETLTRRGLDLALTDEPGATTGAGMLIRAAEDHADLVFDYALAHMAAVQAKIDATSTSRYFANLARPSADAAMIPKLKKYAAAHLDASARGETETAIADIGDRVRVRARVSPALDAWLSRSGTGR